MIIILNYILSIAKHCVSTSTGVKNISTGQKALFTSVVYALKLFS